MKLSLSPKAFAVRHGLRVARGLHLRVFARLAVGWLQWAWLQCKKRLRGVRRPIVHYYALCWNEEALLPFVLDYYGRFCDRMTFFDNGSTDGSLALIAAHPKARAVHFSSEGFSDATHRRIKNSCWKQSRGKADFVVVCDLDEFLYAPDLEARLAEAARQHVSMPRIEGYDMCAEAFPRHEAGRLITDEVRCGVRRPAWLDKRILFDPHRVVETRYNDGAHHAEPLGRIREGNAPMQLLHYKNLGLDYLVARSRQLGHRLSKQNMADGLGMHYLSTDEQIRAEFEGMLHASVEVVRPTAPGGRVQLS